MSEDINLLIIESMQLAIVALIVIICIFNPRLALLKTATAHEAPSYFDVFFRNFIALGFLCNLVYMFCNLGQSRLVGWFDEKSWSGVVATIADICTASAFLYGSLEGRVNKQNRWILGGTLIAISVVLGCFNYREEHITLHVYSLITYSAVSIYVFKQVDNVKREIKNIFSTWTFGIGFSIWAMLQCLPIYIDITSGNLESVKIIGFTASTIGKALILLGIYHFSMRVAKNATVKEREQNEELTRKQQNIRALPELINKVSNAPSTEAHALEVTKHLISQTIFDFHYAIFSEVDYLHRRIICKKAQQNHPSIKDVEDWVVGQGIPFNSPDIMARVLNERVTKYVYGDEITIKEVDPSITYKVDLTMSDAELNPEVFSKYQHKNLDRVFIPVFNINDKLTIWRTDEQASRDARVIAIIEAGKFVRDKRGYLSGLVKSEDELKLYLDNSSQAYQRLYESDISEKVEKLLNEDNSFAKTGQAAGSYITATNNEHIDYVQKVINGLFNETKVDGVVLCLYYKNRTAEPKHIDLLYSPGQERIKKELDDTVSHYLSLKLDQKVPDDKSIDWAVNRIRRIAGARSIRDFEVFVDGTIHAYLFCYSKQENFFNDVVIYFIDSVLKGLAPVFNEKKYHSSTAKLISPNNAITDLELNIRPLIISLQEYFETSFVTFWKNEEDGTIAQQYGSDLIQKAFKAFKHVKVRKDEILAVSRPLVYTSAGETLYHSNRHMVEFITRNNIQTILHKPLLVDEQVLGNISVFFKESVNPNTDDMNYLNLVAIKTQINFQIFNLVNAFRTISDSFTRSNLDDTLQTITDQAMKLLNADPVILFRSYDGGDVFFKDHTKSNVRPFHDPATFESFQQEEIHVDIAEKVLKEKTQFFSDYQAYLKFADLKNTGVANFWLRESIQSMAAIRLSNKIGNIDKAVGVMFINFRTKVSFDSNEELKNIIETFGSFAASSIANGYVMQRNMQYLIKNIQMSQPALEEVVAQGTLHDARKEYLVIYVWFKNLMKQVDNRFNSKIDVTEIRRQMQEMYPTLQNVHEQFRKLHRHYHVKKDLIIKDCDLSKLIRRKLDSLERDMHDKRIMLIDHFSKEALIVECDEGLLGDALYNIMNNACQAMRRGDTLEIRLNKENEDRARIEIIDTGPGINKDLKDFILMPWITDKPSGSGLGLPMANYTVDLHGGRLTYGSARGKTRFTITIPIQQPTTDTE